MNERLALTRPLLALLLLAGLASAATASGASSAPAAVAEAPRFSADSTSVEATDALEWRVGFVVGNPFALGLYLDSLICEVVDLGPGETRGERTAVVDATATVKAIEAIGAGESGNFEYAGPALAEHARLTFRLKLHRADSIPYSLSIVVEALPGPVSRAHPSVFLGVAGKHVETVLFPAARDSGLAPGLLLVHGHANHARKMLRSAQIFALRGYAVMLVSMPGYGQSDGPPDFMGPATVRAIDDVDALVVSGDDVRDVVSRHRALLARVTSVMQARHSPRRTGEHHFEPAPDDLRELLAVVADAAAGAAQREGRPDDGGKADLVHGPQRVLPRARDRAGRRAQPDARHRLLELLWFLRVYKLHSSTQLWKSIMKQLVRSAIQIVC